MVVSTCTHQFGESHLFTEVNAFFLLSAALKEASTLLTTVLTDMPMPIPTRLLSSTKPTKLESLEKSLMLNCCEKSAKSRMF